MNKTQIRKHITKTFIAFVNANFPKYVIEEGEGGRLELVNTESNTWEDGISYSHSDHYCVCVNWAPDQVKQDEELMNTYLSNLKREYHVAQ